MMHSLTLRAEEFLSLIDQMKALNEKIAEACPHKCDKCPIKKKCLEEGQLDIDYSFTIEEIADYLDYGDRVEDEKEQDRLWNEPSRPWRSGYTDIRKVRI